MPHFMSAHNLVQFYESVSYTLDVRYDTVFELSPIKNNGIDRALEVTQIKGSLLDQAMILFN